MAEETSDSYESFWKSVNEDNIVDYNFSIRGNRETGEATLLFSIGNHESEHTLNGSADIMTPAWILDNSFSSALKALNALIYGLHPDENDEWINEQRKRDGSPEQ